MQRSAIREEQQELAADQQKTIDDEHWVLDVPELGQKEYVHGEWINNILYYIEPSPSPRLE